MEFAHLHFIGKTTSPWSIGRKYYSNYICCQRFLWGRSVRGPILGYMLKSYCPYLPNKTLPCDRCVQKGECPFYNLYGAEEEGTLKNTPKLVVTTLTFDEFSPNQISLISRDSATNGVALGPVTVEYIPPKTRFEFEVILTGDATKFADRLVEAARATLALTGWGARCSTGYGRGRFESVCKHGFDEWVSKYVEKRVEMCEGKSAIGLEIFPILMLEKEGNESYTSVVETGFPKKLGNSMSERYWQFFKNNHHLEVEHASGPCIVRAFRPWSRKTNALAIELRGLSGKLQLKCGSPLSKEDLRVIGVSWYGIGKYKNQGFGSLRLKGEEIV